jgi:hypothetical protein
MIPREGGAMRVQLLILGALAGTIVQGGSTLQACGDKFLMVGRGVKFQRAYAAIHPASIVIYAEPQRHAAKAIRDPRLQSDLKLAGHRVLLVETDAALTRALASEKVDLVLTDVADADQTSKRGAASPSKPVVLPVMYEPTAQEAKDVEARYLCRLKSSDHVDRYLATIDDAMKVRVEQKKK